MGHVGMTFAQGEGVPASRMVMVAHERTTTFQGPIPHSVELAALKAVDPAALELVYRLAERQQLHDHQIERETLSSETRYRSYGIFAAVAVIGGLLSVSALALLLGYPTSATIIAGAAGIASVASVFVRGRNLIGMQSTEREANALGDEALPRQGIPTTPPPPPR